MKTLIILFLLRITLALDAQERFTFIDGQKYRIKESGKGDLTVIFESGMSDSLETWGNIPDSVSLFARVFSYDRADIAKSGPSNQERSIPNMVAELRKILAHEKISPPYLLVGHSLGGYITRYFTSKFPAEVKGLLLLDPSPEAYWQSMSKNELNKYIEGGTEWYRTRHKPQYRKEWEAFIPNMIYMKDLNIPAGLPLILVSATETNWFKYQKKQLTGLSNSRQVLLTGSHHIYKDHPATIISYIRELSK